MKKTLLLASIATVAFSVNANAGALTPYVSAKLSAAHVDLNESAKTVGEYWGVEKMTAPDSSDHVWGVNVAAGVAAGAIRAELEWQRHTAARYNTTMAYYDRDGEGEAASTKYQLKTHAYMLNAYYDFDTGTKFTPYVGAGIGLAKTKIAMANYGEGRNAYGDFSKETIKKTRIAWQLGAGISYAMCDNMSLDFGYRYIDYGKINVLDEGWLTGSLYKRTFETTANEIYAGVRYSF